MSSVMALATPSGGAVDSRVASPPETFSTPPAASMLADAALDAELREAFAVETSEQTAAFERSLLRLEKKPRDPELLGALFRCAHTVKGSAAIVGLRHLEVFTHELETVLGGLRDGRLRLDAALGTLLLQSNDEVRRLVRHAEAAPAGPAWAVDAAHEQLLLDLRQALLRASDEPVLEHAETAMSSAGTAEPADSEDGGGAGVWILAERVDRLLDLMGRLVAATSTAEDLSRQTGDAALWAASQRVARLIADTHASTMRLRLVPVSETFDSLRRHARDLGQARRQPLSMQLDGGDTELDRQIVDHLGGPLAALLEHLLGPVQDAAAAQAVRLNARPDGASVRLRMAIDPAPMAAQALPAGLRQAFAAIGGRLHEVESTSETREVEIRLPISPSLLEGFLVGVGAARFVLPLESVVEVLDGVAATDSNGTLVYRGFPVPVRDLRALFGLPAGRPARSPVIILREQAQHFGVRADVLLGEHRATIRRLGPLFHGLRHISGTTILGTGEVALIVDVPALSAPAASPSRTRGAAR